MGLSLKTHWRNALGIALLCGSLLGWGWNASRGWDTPGMLGHEFRQTQTALSIQAMRREGFSVDYSTPILGKPWSIPMEFPFYQWAVTTYCDLTGARVVPGGRMVSVICFVFGLGGVVAIGKAAGFSWGASAIAALPIVAAPVYLFYSRTVMIESMAWAFSTWFLVGVLRYREKQTYGSLLLALSMGAVAVLVKATTWAAFCLPWAVLYFHDAYRTWRSGGEGLRSLGVQALGIGVPLLALGFGWVAWADSIKAQNPLAHFLLSSELRSFNFGSWDMRFDAEKLGVIRDHWTQTFLPGWIWGGIFVAAFVLVSQRLLVFALAIGFVGIQLIFFNLYYAHDYYFYANSALAGLVVGIAGASLWDRRGHWYSGVLPAVVLLSLVCGVQLKSFKQGFERLQLSRSDGLTAMSKVIPFITEPDEVLVAHSPVWNSAEAFYANRRMLMIADFQMFSHRDRVARSLALLKDESVPLLMVMGESRVHSEWVGERIEDLALWPLPLFETDTAITVYARADRWRQMREIIAQGEFAGITLSTEPPKAPVEARIPTVGSPAESVFSQAEMHPISSVFPFGVGGYEDAEGWVVSTHAPTEIYFEVPASATRVRFGFGLGDGVAEQPDFDGLGVNLELVHPDGEATLIHSEWMAPRTDRIAREIVVNLPDERPDQLLYHVVPGPQNRNAYDQAWLRYLRFE